MCGLKFCLSALFFILSLLNMTFAVDNRNISCNIAIEVDFIIACENYTDWSLFVEFKHGDLGIIKFTIFVKLG